MEKCGFTNLAVFPHLISSFLWFNIRALQLIFVVWTNHSFFPKKTFDFFSVLADFKKRVHWAVACSLFFVFIWSKNPIKSARIRKWIKIISINHRLRKIDCLFLKQATKEGKLAAKQRPSIHIHQCVFFCHRPLVVLCIFNHAIVCGFQWLTYLHRNIAHTSETTTEAKIDFVIGNNFVQFSHFPFLPVRVLCWARIDARWHNAFARSNAFSTVSVVSCCWWWRRRATEHGKDR